MEQLLRVIASRQPSGVDVLIEPSVVSEAEVHFDVRYVRGGWVMKKHYHVHVTPDEVKIQLESFSIERV